MKHWAIILLLGARSIGELLYLPNNVPFKSPVAVSDGFSGRHRPAQIRRHDQVEVLVLETSGHQAGLGRSNVVQGLIRVTVQDPEGVPVRLAAEK